MTKTLHRSGSHRLPRMRQWVGPLTKPFITSMRCRLQRVNWKMLKNYNEIRSFSPMIQTGCNLSPLIIGSDIWTRAASPWDKPLSKGLRNYRKRPQTLSDSNSLEDPIWGLWRMQLQVHRGTECKLSSTAAPSKETKTRSAEQDVLCSKAVSVAPSTCKHGMFFWQTHGNMWKQQSLVWLERFFGGWPEKELLATSCSQLQIPNRSPKAKPKSEPLEVFRLGSGIGREATANDEHSTWPQQISTFPKFADLTHSIGITMWYTDILLPPCLEKC